ncbi:hemerythrin domain-containing protein [Streptomyces sp.]|uniref:hemerythrin domain-containing protein n=1 Tax=Streptomyces sp. TaxID=1931 RepID=UPI002F41F924
MADTQQDIDFTVMYATHHAFRRDLRRLAAAVEAGHRDAPRVRAGWDNFNHQLHVHHAVEDSSLWPQVAAKVAGRPGDQRLLDEMEAEHAQLDPRLAAVDTALRDGSPDLAAHIQDLYEVMDEHFTHEETKALPLIQDVLTVAEWKKFGRANAGALGLKGVAVYVPWITDDVPAADRRAFLNAMPPPLKVFNKLLWKRQYDKRGLWQA